MGGDIPPIPAPDARAVLTDDGARMLLSIYQPGRRDPIAVIEITPIGAFRLASGLMSLALRRIDGKGI